MKNPIGVLTNVGPKHYELVINILKGMSMGRFKVDSISFDFINAQAKFFAIPLGKKFKGVLAGNLYTEKLLDYFSSIYYKIGESAYDYLRGYGFADTDMAVENFKGIFIFPSPTTLARRLASFDFQVGFDNNQFDRAVHGFRKSQSFIEGTISISFAQMANGY